MQDYINIGQNLELEPNNPKHRKLRRQTKLLGQNLVYKTLNSNHSHPNMFHFSKPFWRKKKKQTLLEIDILYTAQAKFILNLKLVLKCTKWEKIGSWGFLLFLCASKYFSTQSDPAIPWPWKDPDEASIDGRLNHVFPVCVVIKVSLKYLKE